MELPHRNDRGKLKEVPDGCWLREWMQLWVQGNITTNGAGLWERGLLVPAAKTWRRDRAR